MSSLWGNNSRCRVFHCDSSFYHIVLNHSEKRLGCYLSHTINKRVWHVKHVAQKCFILDNGPSYNNLEIWLAIFTKWELILLMPLYMLTDLHSLTYLRSYTSSAAIFFQNLTKKKRLYFYRLPSKLEGKEGNFFTHVCLSVHRGVPCNHYPWCIEPRC